MAVAGVIQNVDIIDLFLLTNTRIMRRAGTRHVRGWKDVRSTLVETLKERGHLEDLDLYWRQILERVLQKWDWREGTGFVCLRIATNIGLLLTR